MSLQGNRAPRGCASPFRTPRTTMIAEYRFRDEWLLNLLSKQFPAIEPRIAGWRSELRPYVVQAITSAGIASFGQIASVVEARFRIPYLHSPAEKPDRQAQALVPENLIRRYDIFPFKAAPREINVAMPNPLDESALQAVSWAAGRRAVPLYCAPSDLDQFVGETLSPDALVFNLIKNIDAAVPVEVIGTVEPEEDQRAPRAPVVALVNAIIANAVRKRASDIHIEHDELSSIVRYRVDGVLRNFMVLPRYMGVGPVVSRIKIMANLDVAEHMQPQDGRANLRVGGDEIGLRVSTLPTRIGEKVVIRLLNERAVQVSLESLGFRPAMLDRLRLLLASEQGVLLVTGPTGSGKTTTLYAALNSLRSDKVNIVTVEDPIEYRLEGINQVQVNEKQGLTFPSVLRAVLRQDPDAILVGEIRDGETATVCMQAALTGHLVFSTLHTNDTIGAVTRLIDLGEEPFKVASGLIGITAQRLVRRLCEHCRVEADPNELPAHMRAALASETLPVRHMREKGCERCEHTGYHGRFPLIELLEIAPDVRNAIAKGVPDVEIRAAAAASHAMHTMEADALWHLSHGDTTLAEILPYVATERNAQAQPSAPEGQSVSAAAPTPTHTGPLVVIGLTPGPTRDAVVTRAREAGFDPVVVDDGASLIAALTRADAQGVVVSHDLAVMNGPVAVTVIRAARAATGLVDVPIIGVVGADNSQHAQTRTAFTAAGASDVADADPAEIISLLRAAVTRRGGWAPLGDVMKPRTPPTEPERMTALRRTHLLDTAREERFDKLTRLAQRVFDAPIATLTLVDADRQWFKSQQGLTASETPREISFCGHGINQSDLFVVNDATLDPRFSENTLVTSDPSIRFYAGCPIRIDGENIGMFCVIDRKPRTLTASDEEMLRDFGRMAEQEIKAGMDS